MLSVAAFYSAPLESRQLFFSGHLLSSSVVFNKITRKFHVSYFAFACVIAPARHAHYHPQAPFPTVQGELQVPQAKGEMEGEDDIVKAMQRLRVTFNVSVGGETGANPGKNSDFGVELDEKRRSGNSSSSSSNFTGSRGTGPAIVSSSSKMASKMDAVDDNGGTRRLMEKARLVSTESLASSSRRLDLCVS